MFYINSLFATTLRHNDDGQYALYISQWNTKFSL